MAKYSKQDYRNALDAIELAVIELGIPDLVRGWGEPRHHDKLGVKLPTNCGAIYRLHDAWKTANAIMNDSEQ